MKFIRLFYLFYNKRSGFTMIGTMVYNEKAYWGIPMTNNRLNENKWKEKFQELITVCQDEIRKTTAIGKKMISASKTNTNLHEAYEALGHMVANALKTNELQWDNPKVKELLKAINRYETELNVLETDVSQIKVATTDEKGHPQSVKTDKDQ